MKTNIKQVIKAINKSCEKVLFKYNTYNETNFCLIQDEVKNTWYLINKINEVLPLLSEIENIGE